jgi:hypothetical protein
VLENLKKEWRALKRGKPGSRFQQLHEARSSDGRRRWIGLLLGVIITIAGVVALPLPGPGFLVIGIGAALLARESAVVAHVADWIEVRARSGARWASRRV